MVQIYRNGFRELHSANKEGEVLKMLKFIFVLLIFVSLILLIATVLLIINGAGKLKNYSECMGVIEGFRENKGNLQEIGERSFSPVISYTVNGQKYEFIGDYGSTMMKVGQKISILYDQEDPSKATVKQRLYFAPIITGALTLFSTLALVIFIILKSAGLIHF